MTAILYQFMAYVPTTRWPAHVSIAPASIVDVHFTPEEMAAQFGGRLKYRHVVTGEDWIGVWGARKASQFRRLLREAGATFQVEKSDGEPDGLRLLFTATNPAEYQARKRQKSN